MVDEVIKVLEPEEKKLYVDATFGQGGYTKKIFENCNDCKIIAVDRDPQAKKFAQKYKLNYKNRFFFHNQRFSNLNKIMEKYKKKIDGIVFDLGLSNTQLNHPSRGFSFNNDGPLDMRMGNQKDNSITAEKIVNDFSEDDLSNIFFKYGEEKKSFKIARAIIRERKQKRILTTHQLSSIINSLTLKNKYRINNATRSFQALRIFINEELKELEETLQYLPKIINKYGKIIVVSFHSLEDRIVKDFFRENGGICYQNYRNLPPKNIKKMQTLSIITKKPILPHSSEIKKNPRSRSAKLRAAERI